MVGHRWRYKDYSNYIKANGDQYDFKASRNCTRCSQYAYFHEIWTNGEKSIHDYKSNFHSSSEISINKIKYS